MFNEYLVRDTYLSCVAGTDPDLPGAGHGPRRRDTETVSRCQAGRALVMFTWIEDNNKVIHSCDLFFGQVLLLNECHSFIPNFLVGVLGLMNDFQTTPFNLILADNFLEFFFGSDILLERRLNIFQSMSLNLITDYQSWYDSVFCLLLLFLLHCSRMKGDLERTVYHRLARWNLFQFEIRI